ncbi:MarR family transcriptional regulator [Exiguobacterium antarcticum]|uniref:MarR family transcriptional regulator n=1 Tax=Exiguobacterium antarcticum TaxID=132920 RepID=A0ABT6R315_9BACL|nr:MarR family transcriptional regulator [Exiguobacterium antarcticum]MDI3235167.1 MarR family transcriptional regulator [Exiguobacterium antarcticum]
MTSHLSTPSYRHWLAIQKLHHRYMKEVNAVLKDWGLSKSQFDMLDTLYREQSATQKSLETTLELSSGAISQTLKKLFEQHLITRKRIDREKRLVLTASGETIVQESAPVVEVIHEQYFKAFTMDDHESFDRLLHKMQSNHF